MDAKPHLYSVIFQTVSCVLSEIALACGLRRLEEYRGRDRYRECSVPDLDSSNCNPTIIEDLDRLIPPANRPFNKRRAVLFANNPGNPIASAHATRDSSRCNNNNSPWIVAVLRAIQQLPVQNVDGGSEGQ